MGHVTCAESPQAPRPAGYSSYWNNRPGEPTGNGFEFGAGYDIDLQGRGSGWAITPFATYASGEIHDEEHDAAALGVGFGYGF